MTGKGPVEEDLVLEWLSTAARTGGRGRGAYWPWA
jgi:hypothetical protein